MAATGVELATAWVRLVPSIEGVQGAVAKELAPVDKEAEKAGDSAGKQFGKGLQAGMLLAAGTIAVAAGAVFVQGFNNAVELDTATNKVAAQLGLTKKESATIGKAAGDLYAQNFGGSLEEVATATGNVVSSIDGMRDASEEALEDMTKKALNFGTTFEIDTARSTQVVGQLLKTGLVKDADEAFDLLTATMQAVPANVRDDIMDAADEYGPFFQSIGLDGQAAFSLLAAGADQGMYGIDKAGDAIKEFGIRATDLGDTGAQEALASIGLNGQEMANQLLAGGDAAADATAKIVAGLQSIDDPAAQANAAVALFGTPLEDLGKDKIPEFLDGLSGTSDALGDVTGAADAMGDVLNSGVAAQWQGLQRQFEGIATEVGQVLLPVISDLLTFMTENPVVLQAVALALGVLALAFVAVTVATWAMNTALLAIPITWIILAIVALIAAIVLLVMNWDTVVAWITEVWSGFISWITQVIDGFVAWWNSVWEGFASWIGQVWEGFVSWIEQVWSGFLSWIASVVDGFVSWWNGIWSAVGQWFADVWNNLVNGVKIIFNSYVNWLMGIVNGLVNWWNGVWSGIGKVIETVFSGISSFIGGIWDGIVGGIRGAINSIIRSLNGLIDGFNNVAQLGAAIGINVSIPKIPMLADGGTIMRSGHVIVGEEGPELLKLPQGAQVNPNYDDLPDGDRPDVTFINYAPLGQEPAQALSEFANRAEVLLS